MNREKFGSRLGFILVSAGCAVGLGNVWKFPYMCGQNGGAIFILIYLAFLIMLGFPIIICEFAVGRSSQKSCAKSFEALEPKGTKWHQWSYMAMAGNYLLMMFYTMVAGWMLYYCYKSLVGEFSKSIMTLEEIEGKYDSLLSSPISLVIPMIIVVFVSFGICSLGVQKGVEKITKFMMICLLALILVLVFHSVSLPNAIEGVKFYLVPNVSNIKSIGIGNVIFNAMSQAFFTLSIGIGSMAIFGSYLDKSRSLTGESLSITILDTFVAIMSGLIIIPACFSYGIEPDAGPSLIFITLPSIFNKMAAGRIWGSFFFVFLSFAAISTVIAVFENIISFAMDLFEWSRKKSVIINIIGVILLSMPCILGFNVLSFIQPLGKGSSIMDLEDFLVSNNLLPLGALVYVLFCTHKNGWGFDAFVEEANVGEGIGFPKSIRKYLGTFVPVVISIIYIKGYIDFFKKISIVQRFVWGFVAISLLAYVLRFIFIRRDNSKDSNEKS